MGQEFFINSQALEDKIRTLLPSQGGAGAGFDLSASTQIIPIIDVTESAEGSNLRQDLQTSLSFAGANSYNVTGNADLIVNTGYWRVIGTGFLFGRAGVNDSIGITINDGASDKFIWRASTGNSGTASNYPASVYQYDFIAKLTAGDTLKAKIDLGGSTLAGSIHQIASIDGTLT